MGFGFYTIIGVESHVVALMATGVSVGQANVQHGRATRSNTRCLDVHLRRLGDGHPGHGWLGRTAEVLYLASCRAHRALSRGAMPYDPRKLEYDKYFSVGLVWASFEMPRRC
ncbi:hypothetical protein BHM03_00044474 [Ensete ventricosum]|nr:hypothetical protein BHM03_00044474 [Ensete ventricosum]